MKKTNGVPIIILGLIVIFLTIFITVIYKDRTIVGGGNKVLSTKEKVDDFEYMYNVLEKNYPFFEVNKRLNNIEWLANKDYYTKKIKQTSSDREFFKVLDNVILADLNNKHTYMLHTEQYGYEEYLAGQIHVEGALRQTPWERELNNPKAVKRYKYNPTKLNKEELDFSYGIGDNLACRIIEENKVAYLEIKSFAYDNIDFDASTLEWFFNKIKNYETFIIDIRGNTGGTDFYWKEHIVPRLINKPITNTEYMLCRGGGFLEDFMKFKLSQCQLKWDKTKQIKKEKLVNLPPEATRDFKYYIKSVTEIVPQKSVGFKGNVYLLVDNAVYSASEMFASFAKQTGFATLVGEQTGGDGIGLEPILCTLPNSGYIFKFSPIMGLTSTGECNEEFKTIPDIAVDATKNSDFSKDKAIQKVLESCK